MSGGPRTNRPKGKHLDDEILSSYLDGALSARERSAADRHLASCGECARNLRTLRQTVTLLHELPLIAVPHAFTLSEAQVDSRRPAPRGLFVFLRSATAAVAVLLAVVVAGDLIIRQALPTPFQLPQAAIVRESEVPAPAMSEDRAEKRVVETVVVEALVQAPMEATVVVEAPAEAEAMAEAAPAAMQETGPSAAETVPGAPAESAPLSSTPPPGEPFGLGGGPPDAPGVQTGPGQGGLGGGAQGGIGGGGPMEGTESLTAPPHAAEGESEALQATPESTAELMMKAASPTETQPPEPTPVEMAVAPTEESTVTLAPPATAVAEVVPPTEPPLETAPAELRAGRAGEEPAAQPPAADQVLISTFRLVEAALLLLFLALATATIASRARR